MERQSHIDRDSSSKSKKKHKKHKKHKKSKKHNGEEKEKEKNSSKKHKKHRRRSNDEYGPDLNNDLNSSKCKLSATTIVTTTTTKSETSSTLNSKFTEIMKSNGHVVIAKAPTTKFNSANNGAGDESKANTSSKIPTDPNKLVEYMAKSLDSNTSTQVVSSASESDSIRDADSPDVAVIEEDDLNLEELTRQKALLLARLGGIAMSEDEDDKLNVSGMKPKSTNNNKSIDKSKLKRPSNESVNDVILLDDSSNDVPDKRSPPRKKQRGSSRSGSRDRSNKVDISHDRFINRDGRDNRENRKASKSHRNENDNRYKEDLRREIDRDKERNRSSPKPTTHKHHSTTADPKSKFNSNKVKQSSMTSTVREREVANKIFKRNYLNEG